MNEPLILLMAGMAGLVLGTIFFGGLWWTIRKGVSYKYPAIWFLGSWLLRTSIILAGLYVVSDGYWDRLLACLFGFVIMRFIMTQHMGAPVDHRNASAKEASRES
ncbi:ATP synthase protein I [Nitrosomonas nitrosa]|uniref:ATP synthase protein I n=1 Tax=Nitrosomonas nitrosa TaxID=52442 RepID=A0A8H8Z1P3_9PROT|nr:ATP synthase subunit I [Nitrosomonas nitrosa]CAE6512089.1 ATP synthase protein I [Nitrosomonas nitrosa]